MAQIPVDPFDDMNDIFNQMMGGLNGLIPKIAAI